MPRARPQMACCRASLSGLGLALILALGGSAGPTHVVAGPDAEQPLDTRYSEAVKVQRVVWPVFIDPKKGVGKPDDCRSLGLPDIVVREDGDPAEVTSVDRQHRPIAHAILIDTSGSMGQANKLQHAKEAAKLYVDQLRVDEKVMLLTFDDVLFLRAPLASLETPDAKSELKETIDRMEVGSWTSMRDALYLLARYLDAYPQRKVIILLTDGWDTASRRSESRIRGLVSAYPRQNLTIFPINVEQEILDEEAASLSRMHRKFLYDLAWETGGKLYDLRDVADLAGAFQDIRDRLNREVHIGYRARPFGKGPKDPEDRPYTFRKVKIRSLDNRCVVENPKAHRFVGNENYGRPSELRAPLSEAALNGRRPIPATRPLPLPEEWQYQDPQKSYLMVEGDRILGRTVDMVYQAGWLYPPGQQQAVMEPPKYAVFAFRDFEIMVPPFDAASRRQFSGPDDVLLYWFLNGIDPVAPGVEQPHEQSPSVVHGESFVEIRPYLALALFEHYESYNRWARQKMRVAIEEELRAGLPDATAELLEELLRVRLRNPTWEDIGAQLATWLGDVAARDLALALERRAINGLLLTPPERYAEARSLANLIERRWADLAVWFPPPDRVRTLTPLTVMYDPERDQVGFYRVILPRPRFDALPYDKVPDRPLALLTLRSFLERTDLAGELRGRWRVESLEYRDRIEPVAPRRKRRKPKAEFSRVSMTLQSMVGETPDPMTLVVLLRRGKNEPEFVPYCIEQLAGTHGAPLPEPPVPDCDSVKLPKRIK